MDTPSNVLVRVSAKAILFRGSTSATQPPTDIAGVVAVLLVFSTLRGKAVSLSSRISASRCTTSVKKSRMFLRPKRVRAMNALLGYVSITDTGSTYMAVDRYVYNGRRRFMGRVGRQTGKLKVGRAGFMGYGKLSTSNRRVDTESVTLVSQRLVAECPRVGSCYAI